MIIQIPIVTEYVGDMGDVGLGYNVVDGLLNVSDVAYCVQDGENTAIFLKSGMLTDVEVENDMSHCHLVTPLTVVELHHRMQQNFLTLS